MNLPAFALPAPGKSIHVRVIKPGSFGARGLDSRAKSALILNSKPSGSRPISSRVGAPLLEDALLVAGAVEFCDMSLRRP